MNKRIKKLLISYPKCILGWAGDNQPRKSKRQERRAMKRAAKGVYGAKV
jgi:hypothetical protein